MPDQTDRNVDSADLDADHQSGATVGDVTSESSAGGLTSGGSQPDDTTGEDVDRSEAGPADAGTSGTASAGSPGSQGAGATSGTGPHHGVPHEQSE